MTRPSRRKKLYSIFNHAWRRGGPSQGDPWSRPSPHRPGKRWTTICMGWYMRHIHEHGDIVQAPLDGGGSVAGSADPAPSHQMTFVGDSWASAFVCSADEMLLGSWHNPTQWLHVFSLVRFIVVGSFCAHKIFQRLSPPQTPGGPSRAELGHMLSLPCVPPMLSHPPFFPPFDTSLRLLCGSDLPRRVASNTVQFPTHVLLYSSSCAYFSRDILADPLTGAGRHWHSWSRSAQRR